MEILFSMACFGLLIAIWCFYQFVIEPTQHAKNEQKKIKHEGNPISIDFETFGTNQDN